MDFDCWPYLFTEVELADFSAANQFVAVHASTLLLIAAARLKVGYDYHAALADEPALSDDLLQASGQVWDANARTLALLISLLL